MFLVVGRHEDPPSLDDDVIATTLTRLCLAPRWLDPADLAPDSAATSIGIILTNRLGQGSLSMERFVAFIERVTVPLLAFGDAARMLAEACAATTAARTGAPAGTARIDVDNTCVLFDFLPKRVELEGWSGSSFVAMSPQLVATAHDRDGRVVAFEHRERDLFAVDFLIAVAGKAGHQLVDNFARYAGTASGEL